MPVTLPSSLVHKRPDILTAEARLHAAVAAIGVAKASLYPDIALGATWEQAANTTGSLLSSNFRGVRSVWRGFRADFHGGSLRAAKRGAEAEANAAAASCAKRCSPPLGR